jgi:signal transduction histidine kinase
MAVQTECAARAKRNRDLQIVYCFAFKRIALPTSGMNDGSSIGRTYSFRDVFEALASSRRFEEVLDVVLATALRELDADQGSLLLLENDEESAETHLKMLAARGMPREIVERGYIRRRGSISEYVLRERRPMILNERPRTQDYESWSHDTSTPRNIRSALCVPLIARGKVIGTMNLNRIGGPERKLFGEQELEMCAILAGQAAIAIENRRLQDELTQKERLAAVGQTVANISHCIKNMLAGVKGGLGITQMGLEQNDDTLVEQGYQLLKRSTGTLGNLVLDLLDYSREREPSRENFNMHQVLSDVCSTLEYRAHSMQVALSVTSEFSETLNYDGDRDQILRALLNLATNAIEAAGEFRLDGTARVELSVNHVQQDEPSGSDNGKWLEVRVEDNGPGIPPEHRQHIFDLFYSTKGSRGTGIGLATTQKMVEEHGGLIRLHTVQGEGTIFQVLLPVRQA